MTNEGSRGAAAFGIDFGTTNSVVAVASSARRPAIPLLDGGAPHPSIVWYTADAVTAGRQAKRVFNQYADAFGHTLIKSVKAGLGKGVTYEVLGERISASSVASEIFRHLRTHARGEGYELDEAVVTVPVGFDGRARAELRAAAEAAGIYVSKFIHEPFAAVVGHYRSMNLNLGTLPDETVLVFDWGGGTLDITLTKASGGRLEEIATGGLPTIAGDRFDEHIRRWATTQFLDQNGLRAEAFAPTPGKVDLLVAESERAKISLSEKTSEVVRLASLVEINGTTYDLSEAIDREDFEGLIRTDLEDALHEVDRMLDEARVRPDEIERVLLIGGSSRIPLLQAEMKRRFGMRATNVDNSQTIIAEGAAAIAFFKYEPFLARPVKLRLADHKSMTIFDHDTIVPHTAEKDVTLYVTDNRDGEARLIIEEQARPHDRSSSINHTMLSVPVSMSLPRPYNHERVYATFRVDDNLVLHVEAHGAAAGQSVATEVYDLKFGLRVK